MNESSAITRLLALSRMRKSRIHESTEFHESTDYWHDWILQPIAEYNSRHFEHVIKISANPEPELPSCVTHSPFLGQEIAVK